MIGRFLRRLPFYSRYTFRFHLAAAALEGVFTGLLGGFADIVMVKSLGAGPGELTALTIIFPASALIAGAAAGLMAGRAKAPFLIAGGIFGRGPLLLMPLVGGPLSFLGLMFAAATAWSIIIPAQNAIFQANYRPQDRGRIFAAAQIVSVFCGIATTLATGALMERDPGSFHWIYPLGGIAGFASTWILSRVRIRGEGRRIAEGASIARPGALRETWQAARDAFRLLRTEPLFRRFELGFFLYGVAFMTMQPIIPFWLTDHLSATYVEAALAKQGIFGLANMMLLAPFGRALDRLGPVRLAAVSFAILAVFPIVFALATRMTHAYVAFAIYGAAMAGVHIVWNLAAITFAGERESAPFQGVHVMLVGLRGLLAPMIGYLTLKYGDPRVGMAIASASLVAAVAIMVPLARRVSPSRSSDTL